MKKNKLYTVNKYNKNLFYDGGLAVPVSLPSSIHGIDTPYSVSPGVSSLASLAGSINLPKTIQGPGLKVFKPTGSGLGSLGSGVLGAAGNLVNSLGNKLISDGYNAGGVGNGIATVGNVVGNIASNIPAIGPVAGAIINAASGLVGGLTNRTWGTKKNEKNINVIQNNTSALRDAGSQLASASTNDAVLNAAGNMGTTSNFATTDLVKGGWAKSAKRKARKQGQGYINAEDAAFNVQNHGLVTGAENADENQDSTAMSNYIYAFGGPMYDNMGAIDYGFMNDYLTMKNRQIDAKDKMAGISPMPAVNTFGEGGIEIKHPGRLTALKKRTGKTEAELWAEGRPDVKRMITFARNSRKWSKALGGKIERDGVTIPDNVFCGGGRMFALGGDMQFNGSDFTNGVQHIDAGGSHESNPYEGVQVGVDSQGTPNLVEEGEVIFNDYVYSNRIMADDETKERFRISKKRNISYSDLAKKLEKESLERPNDPISQAALQNQMANLADQQERQKQEMEAQKAREAFEALSPEEQVAVMQQMSAQEQAAQEQAIQEQAMAQQQQIAPEEAAMMQEQMVPEEAVVNPEMANMSAYGGPVNKFPNGGALEWLRKNYPNTPNLEIIAAAMEKMASSAKASEEFQATTSGKRSTFKPDYRTYYNSIQKGSGNFLSPTYNMSLNKPERATKHYKELIEAGIPKEVAFDLAFPQVDSRLNDINYYNHDIGLYNKLNSQREDLRSKLYGNNIEMPVQSDAPVAPVLPEGLENASYNTGLTEEALSDISTFLNEDTIKNLTLEEINLINSIPSAERRALFAHTVNGQSQSEPEQTVQINPTPSASTRQATASATPRAQKASAGNMTRGQINAGTWKTGTQAENWNRYTRQGLVDYLQNQVDRYNKATTAAEREAITSETERTVNGIQQAYFDAYQEGLTPSSASDKVGILQDLFNKAGGNSSFGDIESNINLPSGHYTSDNIRDNWKTDKYWGPKTSIRNWGSTEYGKGTDYQDIVDLARKLNLNYGINDAWNYGEGKTLYGMSRGVTPTGIPATANTPLVAAQNVPLADLAGNPAMEKPDFGKSGIGTKAAVEKAKGQVEVEPNYRAEWPRYLGLLGPAVGLGMQALGIGKPNTKQLDAVLEAYDKNPGGWADYKTIGDYLTYRPMDIWAEQNRLNANARATGRAIQNNAAPIGTQMIGLLANDYNNQIASGELYRKGLEYNDALREKTAAFNRGTNQFNAEAFNRAALTNAEIANRNRQMRAQLGLQAAAQKMNANAGWYNGIYGNVGGLFNGIADLGRENAEHNMVAEMAANGIFGPITQQTKVGKKGKYLTFKQSAQGGKINRRRK